MSDNPRTSGRSLLSNYRCTKLRGPGENKVKKKGKVSVGGVEVTCRDARTIFFPSAQTLEKREREKKAKQAVQTRVGWDFFFYFLLFACNKLAFGLK